MAVRPPDIRTIAPRGERYPVRAPVIPHFPVALVAVVGTIVASAKFHFEARGIAVIGEVPGGLPTIRWPQASLQEITALLPVAASCFVMIIAQSAATSKVYAVRCHEALDEDRML